MTSENINTRAVAYQIETWATGLAGDLALYQQNERKRVALLHQSGQRVRMFVRPARFGLDFRAVRCDQDPSSVQRVTAFLSDALSNSDLIL